MNVAISTTISTVISTRQNSVSNYPVKAVFCSTSRWHILQLGRPLPRWRQYQLFSKYEPLKPFIFSQLMQCLAAFHKPQHSQKQQQRPSGFISRYRDGTLDISPILPPPCGYKTYKVTPGARLCVVPCPVTGYGNNPLDGAGETLANCHPKVL